MYKQKGFTLVEGLLIVLIVSVVGFAGYTVWNNQQNNDNSNTATLNDAPNISQEELTEVQTVSLDEWVESTKESKNGEKYYYSKDGNANLVIYSQNPRIYYSSNAPVYCEFNGNQWANYSDFNGQGYIIDASTDACDSVKTIKVAEINGYERFGGALGQIRYIVAAEVDDKWYVFSESVNYNPDSEINQELPSPDYDALNAELKSNVTERIAQTIN
jgi:type II secretory pathway pseudopilin PulG